ncbi:hypothetical protein HZC53_02385 [Candidatus Uhrbacteria bacterium]|nr:hypothetical protein [Candidatus Uhrbacteria bacterium]
MPVPSASDLSRQHLDADNFARLFDDTLSAATAQGRNKPALDSKAAEERFLDLAKQVQGMALTNKDNEELKILGDLASSFTSGKPYGAALGTFRKKFSNWKKEKDTWYRTAQEKSQLKEEIESTFSSVEKEADKSKRAIEEQAGQIKEVAGGADDLKNFDSVSAGLKGVMAGHKKKIESIQRELQDKNLTLNDLEKLKAQLDQEVTKAKTEREKFAKESTKLYQKLTNQPETKTEAAEEKATEADIETEEKSVGEEEEAPATAETARTTETRSAPAVTTASVAPVAAAAAIPAAAAVAAATGEVIQPQRVVQVGGETATRTGTAGQTTEVTTEIEAPGQASQVSGEVSVSAEVTPPSVSTQVGVTVEGKLERAAAARNIPVTAEVTAAVTVTAAVAAGAAQAAAWMTQHQTLSADQAVVQAQQDIQTRTARETEASFTSREELARTKAENVGFSRGITQGMEARAQQTGDQSWTKAAKDVGKFAEQTARQAPQILETPGAKAPAGGAFWQPEELEAIDQAWDGIAAQAIAPPLPTAPETQAPATPVSRAEAPGLGAEPAVGRPRVPRPTPRVATATPRADRLPPGVTLAKEPMRLPPSQPGTRRVQGGAPAEGVGGDTQVSDQSIGFGDERARPSVLEQSVPLSTGSFAQGEQIGPPIAGGGELELPETTGGGTFGEAQRAAELESQRSREKMRAAESLIPGAAGAAVAGALGSEAQVGTEQPSPEEEDGAGGEQEARGETKGGGALEQGRQMIEDKIKEKIEKEIKEQAEKALKKVFQKTTQQAASGGARVTTEVAEGVTSEFIVPLIIMIIQMNVQLFLKYILAAGKSMGVDVEEITEEQLGESAGKKAGVAQSFLEQSFPEDLLTIFLDCNLMCMTNPCCWVLLVVLMVVFLIIAGLDQDVQGLVGNLFDAF